MMDADTGSIPPHLSPQQLVVCEAIAAFEDVEVAMNWFLSPVKALGNWRPVDCLEDEAQMLALRKVIRKLESGHFP